jgi:hypothetical protein
MNHVATSGWPAFFFEGPNSSFFAEPIEETTQKYEALLWTQVEHFCKLPGLKFPGKG